MFTFERLRQTFALRGWGSDRVWYVLSHMEPVFFGRVQLAPGITKLALSCKFRQSWRLDLLVEGLKLLPSFGRAS